MTSNFGPLKWLDRRFDMLDASCLAILTRVDQIQGFSTLILSRLNEVQQQNELILHNTSEILDVLEGLDDSVTPELEAAVLEVARRAKFIDQKVPDQCFKQRNNKLNK